MSDLEQQRDIFATAQKKVDAYVDDVLGKNLTMGAGPLLAEDVIKISRFFDPSPPQKDFHIAVHPDSVLGEYTRWYGAPQYWGCLFFHPNPCLYCTEYR